MLPLDIIHHHLLPLLDISVRYLLVSRDWNKPHIYRLNKCGYLHRAPIRVIRAALQKGIEVDLDKVTEIVAAKCPVVYAYFKIYPHVSKNNYGYHGLTTQDIINRIKIKKCNPVIYISPYVLRRMIKFCGRICIGYMENVKDYITPAEAKVWYYLINNYDIDIHPYTLSKIEQIID